MSINELTIVFPVDFGRRGADLLARVKAHAEFAMQHGIRLVFGYNQRLSKIDFEFQRYVESLSKESVQVGIVKTEEVNLAKLRNVAVDKVQTTLVLLLDLVISIELVRTVLYQFGKREALFVMLPCLYLTEKGSKIIANGDVAGEYIVKDFFARSRRYVQHLAMPSSVILLEKKEYVMLNGFDESYHGHGYEDFDFMLRLFSKNGLNPTQSLMFDEPYKAPLLSRGFRAVFAEQCIDHVINKAFVFHLYHKKAHDDLYYRKRIDNAKIFKQKVQQLLQNDSLSVTPLGCEQQNETGSVVEYPSLIPAFYRKIALAGRDVNDYFVLFDAGLKKGFKKRLFEKYRNLKIEIFGVKNDFVKKN